MSNRKIFLDGILKNNPVFIQLVGMCSVYEFVYGREYNYIDERRYRVFECGGGLWNYYVWDYER